MHKKLPTMNKSPIATKKETHTKIRGREMSERETNQRERSAERGNAKARGSMVAERGATWRVAGGGKSERCQGSERRE